MENELMLSPQMMDQIGKVAHIMASSKATIPNHLKGSEGDCWAVTMQAVSWRMNPFAVAQKTHLVNGTLGYEATLVNAVITTMAPTSERIDYHWFGDWDKFIAGGCKGKEDGLGINVFATMKGEDEPRVLKLLLSQASVRNSPLWKSDPRQQLAYLGVKRWARLHCPDVILGVYTPDEIETDKAEKEINPAHKSRSQSIKDSLKAAEPEPEPVQEQKAPTLAQIKNTMKAAKMLTSL